MAFCWFCHAPAQMICVQWRLRSFCMDSDQSGHPWSLISLHCPLEEALGSWLPTELQLKTLRIMLAESYLGIHIWFEPLHDKTNKMTCAPSEDSDQPGHPPSLIRVFAVRLKKHWVLSCPECAWRRLWSDWLGARSFCWFCHAVAHFI